AGLAAACAAFALALLSPQTAFAQPQGPVKVTLDEAIQLALQHNHNLLAARTTVQQSQAQEITADLRPNPHLFVDWDYLPAFSPTSAKDRKSTRLNSSHGSSSY